MTSIFTILCPEGIVMAADSRISYQLYPNNPDILGYDDNVKKIYQFETINVGVSYWGLAAFQGETVLEHLEKFDESHANKNDNVDSIAEKLKNYLESIEPKIKRRMGLHVAGYVNNAPKLHHVFHESWNTAGEFENEDCHKEYHIRPYGYTVSYRERREYLALFNGDNLIANALFNYAPLFHPYYAITPLSLRLSDCVELAKLIISTSIYRLNYYFDQRMQQNKIPADVGGPIYLATITKEGFSLEKYDPDTS